MSSDADAGAMQSYVCVRCGRDWTADLQTIVGSPGATLDAVCACGNVICAEGSEDSVYALDGLVPPAEDDGTERAV